MLWVADGWYPWSIIGYYEDGFAELAIREAYELSELDFHQAVRSID